jgi:hypothetical protein
VFETVPPTGYAPVRVKLVNNSNAAQNASIRCTSRAGNAFGSSHELDSTFTISAPSKKTTEREFLVPVCTNVSQSNYSTGGALNITVQAGNRTDLHNVESGGMPDMPFTGFSEALAGKRIGDIIQAAVSLHSSTPGWYGRQSFASLYAASMLPSEWRGFSGLDVLAITSDEWASLQPGVKTAILQWVKLGGSLDVYSKTGSPGLEELGIKVAAQWGSRHGGSAFPLGNGIVCSIQWNGSELPASTAQNYASDPIPSRQSECTTSLSGQERISNRAVSTRNATSPLVRALGEKSFAAWQVGLILFVFGIVVGPVNLFYLAGAGRRHRLFYTTPIISVSAAGLLLLVIFFQDGLGGKGHRASVVYLDAAENTAFIHQSQVSRTGVLFGGSFTTEEPFAVSMAVMPDTRWTRLKSRENYSSSARNGSEAQRYSVSDKSYGGDWFQSRTEQAQIIDAVQSTRGRIELKPGGGAPVITSTLTAPLDRIFYLDGQGKYWVSPGGVTTGAEVTLTPTDESTFRIWREEAVSMLPEQQRTKVTGPASKECFYAVSSDPGAGTVATLDSIRWESNTVYLHGPLR